MSLPWPTFSTWNRIQEPDRAALSDILAELLAHGALIGEAGRDRELYLLAREYQRELQAHYLQYEPKPFLTQSVPNSN